MHKLIVEYFFRQKEYSLRLDVSCSKIKKSSPFLFLPRNLPPLVFANDDSTVFPRRVPFNRKWFIQGKIVHTVCDPILRPNWRFLLQCYSFYFASHCFLFFFSPLLFYPLFRYTFVYTTSEIFSLSLSLLKFFSLLFYTFGILVVAKGGRKLTLIFKTVRRIFPLLCCVKNLIPCSFKNYSNKIKQRFFFKISMLKRIFNFYDERRSHLLVIKCHPEKKKN